jgi:predicted GH43/DUF377 family glycosyl hydrolase
MKFKILSFALLCLIQTNLFSQTTENVLPNWALGGFERPCKANPIISPNANSKFFCPMNQSEVKWEESDTFNPAAVVKDGKICVLYRAEDNSAVGIGSRVSRVGLAETEDGVSMTKRPSPVFFPADDNNKQYEWPGGCEDPRVAVTEDGTYVIFYTSWDRSVARLCVATSADLLNWTKHGPVFAKAYGGKYLNTWSKASSIVTKVVTGKLVVAKVNGKYFMYWGEYKTHCAVSEDLVNWTPLENEAGELLVLANTRKGFFDSDLVECGPPAIITDKGILLLYNGKNKTNNDRDFRFNPGTYSAGQMLFDLNDPTKLIDRLDVPFFRPMESYEKSGQYKDGTVFIEGLVYFKKKWFLYYGCADSKVGVAIYDPTRIIHGDIIPDNPKGNGIGYYPFRGLGNKKVSIYASSGETNAGESAFNLLCFEKQNKWCEDKTQNPWVIFELNDYYDINKLVFRDVAPYESGNGNVPEYWIYTSTAGVNDNDWVLALHKTDQGSIDVKVDSFSTPIKSRYIKFVASRGVRTDNGATENAIRIYGFDIFGTLAETVDRGDLVSVGKSVLDFYDAKNYYDQPLHLLDGNLNADNFWQFDRAGSADSLKYVIIDLENEYEIEKFKLYDAGNFDSKSYNLSGYKIYVSEEKPDLDLITPLIDKNTVWRKVVDVTDVKLQNTKTNVIEPVTSRYVKLEIPLSRSSVLNRIYQFEVYKKNTLNGNSQMSLSNIKVWPNYLKAGETLNFEMNESGKLSVYSVQGNLVLKSDLHKNINNCDVDLPVGCYVANINTNHKSKRFKFVVH